MTDEEFLTSLRVAGLVLAWVAVISLSTSFVFGAIVACVLLVRM